MAANKAARKPGRRGLPARLALAGASMLVALVVSELGLRWLGEPEAVIRFGQLDRILEGGQEHRFMEFIENDPELFWRFAPGIKLPDDAWPFMGVVSNAQRLREDHEIPARKEPAEIRILCLGDSCTFGYMLPHDESFVDMLERRLQEAAPGRRIECINAGVPGYSLFQGWRLLETEGLAYEPDLVVLNFGWNEPVPWDGMSDQEHYASWKAMRPPGFLAESLLCRALWKRFAGDRAADSSSRRERMTPGEFGEVLEKVRASAARADAELLVLIGASLYNLDPAYSPGRLTPIQQEQIRFARACAFGPDGAPAFVDGIKAVREQNMRQVTTSLFFDQVHLKAPANAAVAAALAGRIEPWLAQQPKTRSMK